MTHDPLCPDGLSIEHCCDVVAEIRADERAIVVSEFMSNHGDIATFELGYLAALNAAEQAVTLDVVNRGLDAYDDEFLSRSCPHPDGSDSVCYECSKERVVQEIRAAIRALKEKP